MLSSQRHFILEDSEFESFPGLSSRNIKPQLTSKKPWLFRVQVPEVGKDEVVCVIGNIPELGVWQPERCVPLDQDYENPGIWKGTIEIPDKKNVQFRYCVCLIIEQDLQVIVRSWETNLRPRTFSSKEQSPRVQDQPHFYGEYEDLQAVERGWLNKETVVQLKLCHNPLTLWKAKYQKGKIFVKVTPVNIRTHGIPKTMSEALDESLSADTQDTVENSKHSFIEVASLNGEEPKFQTQNQFGHEITPNDMLIFQSTLLFPGSVAFLIDLFSYNPRSEDGEPPSHAGFSYLLPSALERSEGSVVLPVTTSKQRPLGQIRLEYLLIGPLPNFKCDMSISYAKHWKKTRSGLDVGHRGAGSSFKNSIKNCAEVRENTIASLNYAINHGADFVEFDVQLSKDLIPIVYHDFHVCIAMKKKKDLADNQMLELPLKELTLEQLKMLKVYHLTEGKSNNPRFFDEELEDHQPFPTLQQLLEVLNPHVGFNIEIKWTMQMNDGTYELYHPTDLNLYLDTILDVVLRFGGQRRIIFSCFNPDICQVIRLKQNKYPVMFLTVGESQTYQKYKDPRCWSIKSAVQTCKMIEMLGINVHTEDLLREPKLIDLAKRENQVVFCWGDENADPETIKFLKELGLHGVIYDKIYQYSDKEVKESIFLVEARENQKELIQLAAQTAESPQSPPVLNERFLDSNVS